MDVAQLAERRIVVPVVVGSSPIIHPVKNPMFSRLERTFSVTVIATSGPVFQKVIPKNSDD